MKSPLSLTACLLASAVALTAFGCGKASLTSPGLEGNVDPQQDTPENGKPPAAQPGETTDPGTTPDTTTPDGLPFALADACHTANAAATLSRKPVDIIVVIDNSQSMGQEAEALERNINQNFADILKNGNVDYRVILLALHGARPPPGNYLQPVCIQAPLSLTSCNPVPLKPEPGPEERFFHYDQLIHSTDSLDLILATYSRADKHGSAPEGWSQWLRPGAAKTFIEITDDRPKMSANVFDAKLTSLKPVGTFGDSRKRNYTFHSIIGIAPKAAAPNKPYLPSEPEVGYKCATATYGSFEYEKLSIATGGLRFPVCETDSYDSVFRAAAQEVISGAKVSCEFQLPSPPSGSYYNKAYATYTPGTGGPVEHLGLVESQDLCTANNIYRDEPNSTISLCPEACSRIVGDPGAKLEVAVSCGVAIL